MDSGKMGLSALLGLVCLSLAFFPPAATSAEEELYFQELLSVYGASKYEQKVTDAPSSVSVVTAEEIRRYGYQTLAEILRSVRGFYTSYDRNYHYLGTRGFSRPGDYNSRVLVLVNGHRLNDNIYSSVGMGTFGALDVDLIDRVEVIRGPSSSLYGTNAFFAVVNVITRRGRDLKGVEISASGGSMETYNLRLSYGNRYSSGLETLLSGTYYSSKGDDRLYYSEFDDPGTNNGIAEESDEDEAYRLFGTLSSGELTLEGAYIERTKSIPTASFGSVFNDPRSRTTDTLGYVDLTWNHLFTAQLDVKARLSYNHYYYDGDYAFDYGEEDEPDVVVNFDRTKGRWLRGELQLSTTAWEDHRLVAGAEYQNDFQQDQENFDFEVYLDDERDTWSWALYLQDEFTPFEWGTLNLGVRFDDYETFGSTVNPRLALIVRPLQGTTLKYVYGRAFRAPSAYELYYNDGNDTQKPNPDLDPEIINTHELIFEQILTRHIRANVVGFYYRIDDLIDLATDPEDELLVFTNIDEVETRGVELELEGKWDGGFTGRLSYTFQETEDRVTGDRLTNSPLHLAKLNLSLPLWGEKIIASAEELYTSARDTVQGGEADEYFLTNVTVLLKNLVPGLEISGSVMNLLDEDYSDPASEEHEQDVIAQDGRTFTLEATYLF